MDCDRVVVPVMIIIIIGSNKSEFLSMTLLGWLMGGKIRWFVRPLAHDLTRTTTNKTCPKSVWLVAQQGSSNSFSNTWARENGPCAHPHDGLVICLAAK